MASRRMLALAVAQGEGQIDRAMVARVTRARLLGRGA